MATTAAPESTPVIEVNVSDPIWIKFEDKKLFYVHPRCWRKVFGRGHDDLNLSAAGCLSSINLAKESIKNKKKLDLGLSAIKGIQAVDPVAFDRSSQFIRLISHQHQLDWSEDECILKCLFFIPDLESKLEKAKLSAEAVARATKLTVGAVKTLSKYRGPLEIVRTVAEAISPGTDPDLMIAASLAGAHVAVEQIGDQAASRTAYVFQQSDLEVVPKKRTPWMQA